MQAIILEHGRLSVEETSKPKPGHGEVRVKLICTGVCKTDLHIAKGDVEPEKDRLVLGHEGVGTVDAIGAGVNLEEGKLVGVPWLADACGACDHCIAGWEMLCADHQNMGLNRDGTYAEYVLAKAAFLMPIPEGLEPTQAAPIMCAGVTSYKAIKQSGLHAGQWLVIFGAAGGLGHLAVQYAKALGIKVIGVDIGDDKLEFVRGLGAVGAFDVESKTLLKDIKHLTDGGAHGCLVLAPAAEAYSMAIRCTRPCGTVVCAALVKEDIPVPMIDLISHGIKLVGSIVGNRQDQREALQFAAEGKVCCQIEEYPLRDAAKVHAKLAANEFNGRAVLMCCDPIPSEEEDEMKLDIELEEAQEEEAHEEAQ